MKTATSCRKPEAVDVLRMLGVNMINSNFVSKEVNTLNLIMKAFKGENMKRQFYVLGHRINLYSHDWKLGIECEENWWWWKKLWCDERVIKKRLGCKFIRFNLDDPEFEVFKAINKIHHHYKKTERKM